MSVPRFVLFLGDAPVSKKRPLEESEERDSAPAKRLKLDAVSRASRSEVEACRPPPPPHKHRIFPIPLSKDYTVTFQINGKDVGFLVDSGAEKSILTRETLKSCGLGSKTTPMPLIHLGSCDGIAAVTEGVRNVRLVHGSKTFRFDFGVAKDYTGNVLAKDFLCKYHAFVRGGRDDAVRRLLLQRHVPEKSAAEQRFAGHSFEILEMTPQNLLVDTGAQRTFYDEKFFAKSSAKRLTRESYVGLQGHMTNTNARTTTVIVMEPVTIDEERYFARDVVVWPLSQNRIYRDVILGRDFLDRNEMLFDVEGNKMVSLRGPLNPKPGYKIQIPTGMKPFISYDE